MTSKERFQGRNELPMLQPHGMSFWPLGHMDETIKELCNIPLHTFTYSKMHSNLDPHTHVYPQQTPSSAQPWQIVAPASLLISLSLCASDTLYVFSKSWFPFWFVLTGGGCLDWRERDIALKGCDETGNARYFCLGGSVAWSFFTYSNSKKVCNFYIPQSIKKEKIYFVWTAVTSLWDRY